MLDGWLNTFSTVAMQDLVEEKELIELPYGSYIIPHAKIKHGSKESTSRFWGQVHE